MEKVLRYLSYYYKTIFCSIFLFVFVANNSYAFDNYKIKPHLTLQQNDSILENEYDSIKKLVIDKKYAEGLRLALNLYDKSKKENNQKVEFLSTYLLGEIHRLNRNYKKALNSYKKSIELLDSDRNEIGEFQNFTTLNYANNLLRIGTVFQNLSNNDSSIVYFNKLGMLSSLNDQVLNLKQYPIQIYLQFIRKIHCLIRHMTMLLWL